MSAESLPRQVGHPSAEEFLLTEVLQALSDPLRLDIVAVLAESDSELSCSAFHLPVTKSTSTHHFRVLREAGIVRQRYEGTARMNSLRRDDLESAFPGLLASVLASAHRQ
ncbi:DNA-binding transcriptional ArsR family regulator [Arthrobacter sp. CAN_A212]|uniref:ArsR/SmtB family transcription factor n=1 Tax=Arthrobacter sp. CAN_A212 TaxID=2787719 RepID=UPI0018C98A6A